MRDGVKRQGASLGAPVVGGLVAEQHGGAARAEEAVGNEHAALVAEVPVLRDVLRAHHQAVGARVHLHSPDSATESVHQHWVHLPCTRHH